MDASLSWCVETWNGAGCDGTSFTSGLDLSFNGVTEFLNGLFLNEPETLVGWVTTEPIQLSICITAVNFMWI